MLQLSRDLHVYRVVPVLESGKLWRKSPDSTSRIQKLKLGMGKLWDHLRRLSKPFLPETQWFSSYSRSYTVTLADL